MSNSTAEVEADVTEEANKNKHVCANCGIAGVGVDNNELEECEACQSVRHCSDKCREEHREQHEEECKNRKAELHDKELFTQPDGSHLGECPICFLPMPLDPQKTTMCSCCSKTICNGCIYADRKNNNCPFCRESMSADEESNRRFMERVKANDPAALSQMGGEVYHDGDYDGAFEYFAKSAELGDIHAHYQLGIMYDKGKGVDKDRKRAVHHWEKAAIGGHPIARYDVAVIEEEKGHAQRAVKHYVIAANLGDEESMKTLWDMFKLDRGYITKEDLEAVLRSHQAAVDEMKSPQRKAADRAVQKKKKNGSRG